MAERPFNDSEVKVLRGMIDDYLYERERRRMWGSRFSLTSRVVLTLAAAWAIIIPLVNLILNVRGGH